MKKSILIALFMAASGLLVGCVYQVDLKLVAVMPPAAKAPPGHT